jgi:hypothetical protein
MGRLRRSDRQRQGLDLHWWDIGGKEAMLAETGGLPANDGTGGTESGAAILDDLGLPSIAYDESIAHAIPEGSEEALDRAAGRYAAAARRFVTLRATGPGNARLRVGSTVTLQSVPPRFAGAYRVVKARHSMTPEQGYLTEIEANRTRV